MSIPFETFKGPICKGSRTLGSACGRCEKCQWESSGTQTSDPVHGCAGKPLAGPAEQWSDMLTAAILETVRVRGEAMPLSMVLGCLRLAEHALIAGEGR